MFLIESKYHLFGFLVLGGLLITYELISFFTHPLREVPGPLRARLSRYWIFLIDASGHRSSTIHSLHKKYGPTVRIGPNEVSFSSAKAMRDIYGPDNNCVKAPVYQAFQRPSSFSIREKKEHRARQKRVSHVFAPSSIAGVEPIVHERIERLLKIFHGKAGQSFDIMEWFRMFALDVVGTVFIGKNFGGLDNEAPPQIMRDLDEVFPSLWFEWYFPILRRLLLVIPYRPLTHFLRAGSQFYQFGSDAFYEYISLYGRSGDRRDLLTKLIAGTEDYPPLPDSEIVLEMTNLIFAGTDTTSNTLSYMFYEMAKNPVWQINLQEELDKVDFANIPNYKDIRNLPVLNAIIYETLRVHPAAPASLQRVTPKGGVIVDGIMVPQNSLVSCQSYTTQRSPDVYQDPDAFNPGRWLDAPEDQLQVMHEHILVWGKGLRACVGKPMAYMELKLATAAIMKKFGVQIGSSTTDDDMEMTDHFALVAKGGKCMLLLHER